MFDAKSIVLVIGTCGLVACAVICLLKGSFEEARMYGALLVPSIGQMAASAIKTTATDGPAKVTTESK